MKEDGPAYAEPVAGKDGGRGGDGKVLEISGIVKTFGDLTAVDGVDLQVGMGEICGLVGPDGAGKTTTLRIALGLMAPDEGKSLVTGIDVASGDRRLRKLVSYVSQAFSLYGDLSVEENMWFFGRMYGLDKKTFRHRLDRLLTLTGLSEFKRRKASALSGGMYKKLALACALLQEPTVLIMDEPTNGVDVMSRRQLWELVAQLASQGAGVLVATPLMEEAERCHKVFVLTEGRIVLQGRPEDLERRLEGRCWVVELEAAGRKAETLLGRPWVSALSVESRTRLRIVTSPDGTSALKRFVAAQAASIRPVSPMFEDVYLAGMAETEGKKGTGNETDIDGIVRDGDDSRRQVPS